MHLTAALKSSVRILVLIEVVHGFFGMYSSACIDWKLFTKSSETSSDDTSDGVGSSLLMLPSEAKADSRSLPAHVIAKLAWKASTADPVRPSSLKT